MKTRLLVPLVTFVCGGLTACVNGERSYEITDITYSNGLDTLFSDGQAGKFKQQYTHSSVEITIKDDSVMTLKGLGFTPSLTLNKIAKRKEGKTPKNTYRAVDKQGNAFDVSLTGMNYGQLTIRTRGIYLFSKNLPTDSANSSKRWLSTVEMKGKKN